MKAITFFIGEYHWLSNSYPSLIIFEGIKYPTVEHAFQAMKSTDVSIRQMIANLSSPGEAKKYGKKIDIRPDWDQVKVTVMHKLLEAKFEYPGLKKRLQATRDIELVKGNYWHDNFWGRCLCKRCRNDPKIVGRNMLGNILMSIRTFDV